MNADGSFDTSFNTGTGASTIIRAVALQPDSKILVAGLFTVFNNQVVPRIVRLNSNGSIDPTFTSAISFNGQINDVVVQPDGKILVGGQFYEFNGDDKLSFVRLQNSAATPRRAPFDFDDDNKTDVSIFRSAPGEWWYLRSSDGGNRAFAFGNSADKIAPADYTGDGKTDIAFWRPATGEWFVLRSENLNYYAAPFGISTDIPVPGDYDGDGRSDFAVFRPSEANWYLQRSTVGFVAVQFGLSSDKPVPNAFIP